VSPERPIRGNGPLSHALIKLGSALAGIGQSFRERSEGFLRARQPGMGTVVRQPVTKHPVAPALRRIALPNLARSGHHYIRLDVAYLPIHDAPPLEWRVNPAAAETNRIRALDRAASDVAKPP
jgi:hypothetical protein